MRARDTRSSTCRPKDQRARLEQRRVGVRMVRGFKRALGDGHVAGLPDEAPELPDGDRGFVDPEPV
jgi:hypothetical protein